MDMSDVGFKWIFPAGLIFLRVTHIQRGTAICACKTAGGTGNALASR